MNNNWRIVPVSEYNLRERTSLARINPNLILVENIQTKERRFVYKQMFKGGKQKWQKKF